MKPQEAFTRNFIDEHKIIVFVIVIAVLVFATVTFLDFRNKGKYDECKKACEDSPKCNEFRQEGYGCLKWNTGDCLNNCVQKYK